MPQVFFTSHLSRHLPCDTLEVEGRSVAAALEAVFALQPSLRSYLLDDQGAVRQHVMIFVDDRPLADRLLLSDSLTENSKVHVMQALSGG